MKNLLLVAVSALLIANQLVAQKKDEKDTGPLNVLVGGSFGKPKIMPKLEKFGIAQITVNYKLNSSYTAVGKEKSSGKTAGARLDAYLETTDGELTPQDFQEVTDHFYSYFQRKLKEKGIDTVGWNTITSTAFYKEADEKELTHEQEKGAGQVWVSYNANKGSTLYNGGIPFAFGKIKRASRFSEEIGAPAGYFHITVDFVDIMVNVDIKSKQSSFPSSFYPNTRTTDFKYESATRPDLKIIPSSLGSTFLNLKQ